MNLERKKQKMNQIALALSPELEEEFEKLKKLYPEKSDEELCCWLIHLGLEKSREKGGL